MTPEEIDPSVLIDFATTCSNEGLRLRAKLALNRIGKKPKRDWTGIEKQAAEAAQQLGHKLGAFGHPRRNAILKVALCATCGGCCLVIHTPTKSFEMHGRLLRYECGDSKAVGILR